MVRSRSPASSGGSDSPRKLNGAVLLVEDEPSLRSLFQRMLEFQGLTVRSVEAPEVAIEIAHSRDLTVDLLLTDLQLPGMSGLELAARVRAMRPGLPIVYMSGHPREESFGVSSREYVTAEFLQKPFSQSQLGEVMRRVLSAKPTPPPSDTDDTKEMKPLDENPPA